MSGAPTPPGRTSPPPSFDMEPALEARWEAAYAAARRASEAGEAEAAVQQADAAWALLPEPRWRCSMAYLTALRRIAMRWRAGAWAEGVALAQEAAAQTPFAVQRPVFEVQAGRGLLALGQREAAWRCLDAAYRASGDFGFRGEDPALLAFYRAGA